MNKGLWKPKLELGGQLIYWNKTFLSATFTDSVPMVSFLWYHFEFIFAADETLLTNVNCIFSEYVYKEITIEAIILSY